MSNVNEFSHDDELDLIALGRLLYARKWFLFRAALATGIILLGLSTLLPVKYTASALVAPAEVSGDQLTGLMKQYGGIASLAGVSVPAGDGNSNTQLAIELLQSREFLGNFVQRRNLLPDLMAVKSWDIETDAVKYEESDYIVETNEWVRDVDPPFKPKPSLLEAHEEFTEILKIDEDAETGFITISIKHNSPRLASDWVNWLVKDVNDEVRAQDIHEATRSIVYLEAQIAGTPLAELQAVFFELIQAQMETKMLAEVRPEYVFKTIDPAVPPEEENWPYLRLIAFLFGMFFGGAVAVIVILIRNMRID